MKKHFFFCSMYLFLSIILTGCTDLGEKKATISAYSDSDYVKTFQDLHLGILFDFDFTLPNANKTWVNLWVERYQDGKKESQPLTQLSYGNSPNEEVKGHLGFGIINPNGEDTFVFLYGPGVSTQPTIMVKKSKLPISSTWGYAREEEEIELESGETTILAAYRQTEANSMTTIDLHDEEAVTKMIQQDDIVLLLKIKIEEVDK